MKKSCKIFSAVALSAVLAMGTAVPAFAYTDTGTDQDTGANGILRTYDKNDLNNGGASTNVNISTYSSAYNITVPLWAPFAVDTEGGAGIAPTNYYIQNNNESTIYVTEVAWEMDNDSDWTFKYPGSGNALADMNPSAWSNASSNQTATDPVYGSFVIGLTPSGTVNSDVAANNITTDSSYAANAQTKVSTWVNQNVQGRGKRVEVTGKASDGLGDNGNFKYWVINPKASGATANLKTMIDLDIQNTALNAPNETITKVAAITYTVSARQPV